MFRTTVLNLAILATQDNLGCLRKVPEILTNLGIFTQIKPLACSDTKLHISPFYLNKSRLFSCPALTFQEMISEIDITSTVAAVEHLPNLWAPLQKLVDNANTALDSLNRKNSTQLKKSSTHLIVDMVLHSVMTHRAAHSELVELANSFELLDMSKVSALND